MAGKYVEVYIDHSEDGWRWKISEVDGIFKFEYQEWIEADKAWEVKSEFEGFWCSEVDDICEAMKLVAEHAEM